MFTVNLLKVLCTMRLNSNKNDEALITKNYALE